MQRHHASKTWEMWQVRRGRNVGIASTVQYVEVGIRERSGEKKNDLKMASVNWEICTYIYVCSAYWRVCDIATKKHQKSFEIYFCNA